MKVSDILNEKGGKKTGYTAWVIVYTNKKIILGKRSPSSNNPNQWNFFGGNIEQGDTAVSTAIKEMQEETGVLLKPTDLRYITTIGTAHYFACKISNPEALRTTSEISAMRGYKLTDLPNNLHSKTATFFSNLDQFFT